MVAAVAVAVTVAAVAAATRTAAATVPCLSGVFARHQRDPGDRQEQSHRHSKHPVHGNTLSQKKLESGNDVASPAARCKPSPQAPSRRASLPAAPRPNSSVHRFAKNRSSTRHWFRPCKPCTVPARLGCRANLQRCPPSPCGGRRRLSRFCAETGPVFRHASGRGAWEAMGERRDAPAPDGAVREFRLTRMIHQPTRTRSASEAERRISLAGASSSCRALCRTIAGPLNNPRPMRRTLPVSHGVHGPKVGAPVSRVDGAEQADGERDREALGNHGRRYPAFNQPGGRAEVA